MQEADIRKSLLMNADENIIDLRHDCEQKVLNTLKVPQKLSEILSVPKGKVSCIVEFSCSADLLTLLLCFFSCLSVGLCH